jgi:hypothetical protein
MGINTVNKDGTRFLRGEAWDTLRAVIGPEGITCVEARPVCGDANLTATSGRLGKHVAAGRLFKAQTKKGARARFFLSAADRDAWMAANGMTQQPAEPLPIVAEGAPWGAGPMPAGWFSEPARAWASMQFRSDLLDPECPHNVLRHNDAQQMAKQARQAREAGKGWAQGSTPMPGTPDRLPLGMLRRVVQ